MKRRWSGDGEGSTITVAQLYKRETGQNTKLDKNMKFSLQLFERIITDIFYS